MPWRATRSCLWIKVLPASLLACSSLWGVHANAQPAPQNARKLEFEVATIKPTAIEMRTSVRGGERIAGDRAEYIFMTVRQLIAAAYQVRSWQVEGPDELVNARFDVVCKMPAESRKEDAHLMLQSLLAERFKLALHREVKQQNVLALVVAKDGPKLKESPAETSASPAKEEPPKTAAKNSGGAAAIVLTNGPTRVSQTLDYANAVSRMEATRMTMPYLADLLGRTTLGNGNEVVDMTGLKGLYDVVLDIPFAAFGIADPGSSAERGKPAEAASDPRGGWETRSLKNLGLELEKRRVPVEQLIVDHVLKTPTQN
jgi:uncharacterized protein (TIGR03435 family)